MSTPLSRLEITAGNVSVVGRAPNSNGECLPPVQALRYLVAYDPTPGTYYALFCSLSTNADSTAYETAYYVAAYNSLYDNEWQSGDPTDPTTWFGVGTGATYQIVLADGGIGFSGGGTLAIEKDYDATLWRFITPAGEIDVPLNYVLTDVGAHTDANPISTRSLFSGYGHQLLRHNSSDAWSESADYSDFFFKSNGTAIDGAGMSQNDPGIWDIPIPGLQGSFSWALCDTTDPPLTGPNVDVNTLPSNDHQNTSTYTDGFVAAGYSPITLDTYFATNQEYVRWIASTAKGKVIPTVRLPEHGAIFAAYVSPASADTVLLRRTYDKGESWTQITLYQQAGSANVSPSLAWDQQRLYAVWQDAASEDMLQSNSQDLGTTWSAPVTLPISGTYPKLLVDPTHGIQFYFYLDGSNNVQLFRSADYFNTTIEAHSFEVVANITPQTIAAEIAPDGSLLVGYIAAGNWQQVRSRDYGLTWA